jgi:hypothetical protein
MIRAWIVWMGMNFLPLLAISQLWEDFSDGDLTDNPAWIHNNNDWIINPDFQLRSNNLVANSIFFMSTPVSSSTGMEWEFFVRLQFNTSSTNYADVFLTASSPELNNASTTGYFIRIGNTQDEIALYRKDAGSIVKIIDGIDGITNSNDNILRIKVSRDINGEFQLWRDVSTTSNPYVLEGKVTDATYHGPGFFGILIRQSTSSFFQKHFFDDIQIRPYVPDLSPPDLLSAHPSGVNTVDLLFSESLDAVSALNTVNYNLNPVVVISSISFLNNDRSGVRLELAQPFQNNMEYQLAVQNISDVSGNLLNYATKTFSYYIPKRHDVIIHEIMADPSPQVGLPNVEYIELRNVSGKKLDLSGWRISTSTSISGGFPPVQLAPDSLLIICPASQANQFQVYGKVAGIAGFPSLPNSGSLLSITSREGSTIHAIEYSDQWFDNAVKKEGGWSLEMVDITNPCSGRTNWKASMNPAGGTPGKNNSVAGIVKDDISPSLLRTYSLNSSMIRVVFDESLDSLTAANPEYFKLSPQVSIAKAVPLPPLFREVELELSTPLQQGLVYSLTADQVKDCSNNEIGRFNIAKAGIATKPSANDIVINEILFNPRPGANDYVEMYNKSGSILDLSTLFMTNRNSSGSMGTIKKISETPYAFYPEEYIVLTEDAKNLALHYHVKDPSTVLEASLPSLPDDKGTLIITTDTGIIDEVNYSEKWHFALLKNREGVALERIDPSALSTTADNWHTASASSGFGTPGYRNSQHRANSEINATIEIIPKIFSPDQDGWDDYLQLHYEVEGTGYMINTTIFDARGNIVRYLVKNTLLGRKGSFRWDGLDEKLQKLRTGRYIIFTEIFNLEGKRSTYKNVAVLAGKN